MNAIANMTNALTQAAAASQHATADTYDGRRTANIRDILQATGPMRAREIAEACELRSSGLVSALLKYDIAHGRVEYNDGVYSINEEFVTAARAGRQAIEWIPVGRQLPDADTTVLVATRGCNEPVWLGYYGDGQWFDIDATRIQVTHWAQLPESPATTA
jgi:hypothetical protein